MTTVMVHFDPSVKDGKERIEKALKDWLENPKVSQVFPDATLPALQGVFSVKVTSTRDATLVMSRLKEVDGITTSHISAGRSLLGN